MRDLSVNYMGLELKNPLIIGSSGLTNNVNTIKQLANSGASAVVLKSLFEEQILMNLDANMAQNVSMYQEGEEYLKIYENRRVLDEYLDLIADTKRAVDIPVIASINCNNPGKWTDFALKIQDAGADALELNIFLQPSHYKEFINDNLYNRIIDFVCETVKIPVAIKVGPYFSNLAHSLTKLSERCIKGIVLFNRFYSVDIDIEAERLIPGNAYSTPEESANIMRWVAILANRVDCDLSASGGIHSHVQLIKLLLAGAKTCQITSALYKHGPMYLATILDGLTTWMKNHNYARVTDFCGKLSMENTGDPAFWERVQFMRYQAGLEQ